MERYRLPQQEQLTLERLRQPFAVYQFVDKRVAALALSDGFCKLFGYDDRAEAYHDMNNDMYKDAHPDDVARIANAAIHFATEGGKYEVVYRTRAKDGSGYRIVHAYGEHVYTDTGVQLAHVWYSDEGIYSEEFSQQGMKLNKTLSNALHESGVAEANRYDHLTGLPSMAYFFELAQKDKESIRVAGGNPVMMYLNLVGMEHYNAKHGFAEGDRLLQSFAKILAMVFGNESCCRISGDHFAVHSEETGLEQKLQQVFQDFHETNGGQALPIHVGVYVAQFEKAHTSVACDRAKLACSALKGRYETAVSYYSKDLSEDAAKRQYIVENIDRAIAEKWIQVYLQPIVRAVNDRVCDVEALARWVDPERGVLSPADFIPALEGAGLIYKLDLYMVDQILEAIKEQKAAGFYIIPHSINLSRSDFGACDIVEEIRRRVDEAGVDRSRITVEITESTIGGDFEFMKEQVERFQKLGFPVWMDDFGSAYSSLDVLQGIRFDLLKFDMSFMRKLDEGDGGRIILTDLMRMATSLGLDTVCEGVETEEQVRFLREIGCSKLQGYYYSKPIPFDTILELHEEKDLIENENPEEAAYYESIGRVNLFDLGVAADRDKDAIRSAFDAIPIAVLEIEDDTARYVRSNRSYRDFAKRFFDYDVLTGRTDLGRFESRYNQTILSVFQQCRESGNSVFFDETMPEGSKGHFLVRRIDVNPVTKAMAVVFAVLSITEPNESEPYADMARALAADYYRVYVVDLETDRFVAYNSQADEQGSITERHGEHFFANIRESATEWVYEDDREMFVSMLAKDNVLWELGEHGSYTVNCRLIDTGNPVYMSMKITRIHGTSKIIVGISNIDEHMKQLEEEERLRRDKASLSRIAALSPDFIVLYTIDPVTNRYTQYNPSSEFADFGLATQGEDFFADVVLDAPKAIAPEDMERHLRVLTKENMLSEIQKNGYFVHRYRLVIDGKRVPTSLRATMVEEEDGEKIILGVASDENAVIDEERLIYARLHALTGNFIVVYVVDPETDRYREFSATVDYEKSFYREKEGLDFFSSVRKDAHVFAHPDDLERFLAAFTKENVLNEVERSGIFTWGYRILMDGKPLHVQMKAAMVEEKEGPRLIVGLNDVDAQVRQEEEYGKRLLQAQTQAKIDATTGVKNKHAYLETEASIDRQIAECRQSPFAIVVFDVNDLKTVNDTAGHQAGDQYLRNACAFICDTFKRSPVFRIGGDEFAVVAQGQDYARIDELLVKVSEQNEEAFQHGGIIVACGMSRFEGDKCVADVFKRADREMYGNKCKLKGNR